MKYKTILFDLDGTLVDSSPGMILSLQHALDAHNIDHSEFNFKPIIGLPLSEGLPKLNSVFEDKILLKQVSSLYREHYGQEGVFQCTPYAGIKELLSLLKKNNLQLGVATLKPTVFAEKTLVHHDLAKYFDYILGTHVDQISVSKAEVLKSVLQYFSTHDKTTTIMIGDGIHDINGAHKSEIDVIGVTYGFGLINDLIAAKPSYLVHSVNELTELLVA
jgi:phosphoglycolate phosphatase